ncbi:MAG: HAMP domain-containing histidine kinase [Chloroflexi bacterium]|nr:HAMP domain-containing histidine kinase [Chloroflexota bacterium]
MPIRVRLTLGYVLFFGIAIIAVTTLLYLFLSSNLQQEVDRTLWLKAADIHIDLTSKGETYLDQMAKGPPPRGLTTANEFAQPGIYVQILDSKGVVVDASANLQGQQLPTNSEQVIQGLAGKQSIQTLAAGENQRVRVITMPLKGGNRVFGLVQVGQSLHNVEATINQIGYFLLFSTLGLILVAGLSGWFLARKAFASIDRVVQSAQEIDLAAEPGKRLIYEGPEDEIGGLVRTLNAMLERTQEALESQKQFIADSSHELRTPLTSIRGNVDLLERQIGEEDRRESLDSIKREAERMSRIVSNLLLLAQLDAQQVRNLREVELDTLLLDVFRQAKVMADGRTVELGNEDVAMIKGDADQLKQMILNLVENAIKYTPAGGKITLSLGKEGRWAKMEVSDSGVGIPQEHLPHIFDRFYRVDKARSRGQGGTGLGLAIVKSIAELHGGEVTVTSSVGEGSTFTVWLRL